LAYVSNTNVYIFTHCGEGGSLVNLGPSHQQLRDSSVYTLWIAYQSRSLKNCFQRCASTIPCSVSRVIKPVSFSSTDRRSSLSATSASHSMVRTSCRTPSMPAGLIEASSFLKLAQLSRIEFFWRSWGKRLATPSASRLRVKSAIEAASHTTRATLIKRNIPKDHEQISCLQTWCAQITF